MVEEADVVVAEVLAVEEVEEVELEELEELDRGLGPRVKH